ncbi:tyrosine-type recombinase/integrase [Yersinia mollaretii]|uniref:Tyrosine-type recombinase/integrase n=1 Tax=Yersinia mollaretii TaxID=33060 RepID=A0AA44CMT3_YERMO|nr:site-specific integrase [Yersinia mollaretii]NIL23495.1 tyrosine-type recombinase/integrase [Yersinia mollaretii]
MLTDTKLKSLKPRDKLYKITDRDGLYVAISPGGTVSFRYDYRINKRRETLTIGKYGPDGISLSEARDQLYIAKKMVDAGFSPATKKKSDKYQIKGAKRFKDFADEWTKDQKTILAPATFAMRQAVLRNDVSPIFDKKLMSEITTTEIRDLCDKIKERGAPSTALMAKKIIDWVYTFATDRGYEIKNPAERIKSSSIAKFKPRERALNPKEINIFFNVLERTGTMHSLRLSVKFVFLTMVRKREFLHASWEEIDFDNATWTIPAERMKMTRPHVVYLSKQALDILIGFKAFYCETKYLVPGRYSSIEPLSDAALNRVINTTVDRANKEGFELENFSVHDLRRTASTLLHEHGFNSDWIEKCLAHEQKGTRAVYNKAEYAEQRRDMLQQWANMVDGWIAGSGR